MFDSMLTIFVLEFGVVAMLAAAVSSGILLQLLKHSGPGVFGR